jgi:hypothetical protein
MRSKKFIRMNPHLPVKNLQQTLDYYRDNLGFYEEWTWTNDEGKVIDGVSGGMICDFFLPRTLSSSMSLMVIKRIVYR